MWWRTCFIPRSRRGIRRLRVFVRTRSADSPTRRVRISSAMNSKTTLSLNMRQMVAPFHDSAAPALILVYAGDQPDLLAAKTLEFGDLGVDGLPFPLLLGRDSGVDGDPQAGFWDFGHVREKGLRIIGLFTQ